MWGWFFWQGLETIRAGSSGARSTEQPAVKTFPAMLSSLEKHNRFVLQTVGPDFGTSRVNTDTGVSWDYSVGHGHLHKIQGFGSRH